MGFLSDHLQLGVSPPSPPYFETRNIIKHSLRRTMLALRLLLPGLARQLVPAVVCSSLPHAMASVTTHVYTVDRATNIKFHDGA